MANIFGMTHKPKVLGADTHSVSLSELCASFPLSDLYERGHSGPLTSQTGISRAFSQQRTETLTAVKCLCSHCGIKVQTSAEK